MNAGERRGFLTITGTWRQSGGREKAWQCICDCGEEVWRRTSKFKNVETPMCNDCNIKHAGGRAMGRPRKDGAVAGRITLFGGAEWLTRPLV